MVKKLKNKDINQVREELLEKQEYKCGICEIDLKNEDNTNRHTDHNHTTGRVRGVLCRRCNLLEGSLSYRFRRSGHVAIETDYLDWLTKHLAYLRAPETDYEHPEHSNVLVRKFKNKPKDQQIQMLVEKGVDLTGKETKDQLLKIFRKL